MPRQWKWFDGHLDLAYLSQYDRNMSDPPESCGGSLLPAAVTFPSLRAGNVQAAFATVFVQRHIDALTAQARNEEPTIGPWTFTSDDQAHTACVAQFEIYARWEKQNLLTRNPALHANSLRVAYLLEGCRGVRSLADIEVFHRLGVRIASLTWAEGSQYAGGDQSGGDITPAGLALVDKLDSLGIVHDASHLSEQAFWTLLSRAKNRVIASHSNVRSLLPGKLHPERHLSDQQIKAIANRTTGGPNSGPGIIGINLFQKFLISGPAVAPTQRATIADVLRHLAHMEDVVGRRDFLALGSDMDGGFSAALLPVDLDRPEKLDNLAEALSNAGWSDDEIHRFAWQNWADLAATF